MNYWGEDDYTATWGNELDYYGYDNGEWEHGHGDTNYFGNQLMLLENNTNHNNTNHKHDHNTYTTSIDPH